MTDAPNRRTWPSSLSSRPSTPSASESLGVWGLCRIPTLFSKYLDNNSPTPSSFGSPPPRYSSSLSSRELLASGYSSLNRILPNSCLML